MTPDRALHRDIREDIEGLAHRARITLPRAILADGTAAPDQVACLPPDVALAKALLPHRERPGAPMTGPGAALVGTRDPDLGPWLPGAGLGEGADRHVAQAKDRAAILAWLYAITGLRYASAALWRTAGWEIGWVANWLDALRVGGPMAGLIVAERQASAAVQAARIAHRGQGGLAASGTLLATRAVIDMLAAFAGVIDAAMADAGTRHARAHIAEAEAAIVQRLRSCIRAIEEAKASHRKVGAALDHARDLIEALGLFTAVGEPIGIRMIRIAEALPTKDRIPPPLDAPFAAILTGLSDRLEAVIATGPTPVTPDTWCAEMTGDLTRLHGCDARARLAALARVRTDLVYKLLVTRRLDRVFTALPWMLAPSGAFRQVFGGPVGAVATLFEIARHREIALELKNRTFDSSTGPRLDTLRGKLEYGKPVAVIRAVRFGTRAGFWLAASALSHDMVGAFLGGRTLDPAHPLPCLATGKLGWSFATAMGDAATVTTVTETELAKPLYATRDADRDLARYMGLGIADLLGSMLIDAFPADRRGPAFGLFLHRADERRKAIHGTANPFAAGEAGAANRELVRSILKSLDTPMDGSDADWREEDEVDCGTSDRELARFDARLTLRNGARASDGGAVRHRAKLIRKAQQDPGRMLRGLVDRARDDAGDDRPLALRLSGHPRSVALTPVAQTGLPVLWFRPGIDTPIHDWIAAGAPMGSSMALGSVRHAGLIARAVEVLTAAMPSLFGPTIPSALRARILVPLWTGLAGITEDHAHVR